MLISLGNDLHGGRTSHTLYSTETVSYGSILDGETNLRMVHIRRQYPDAEGLYNIYVLCGF